MAQDEYYYEIQLTNKQLIFYFIAAAAGFILSFVAGIMVGRGVDGDMGAGEVRIQEESLASVSESPSPSSDTQTAESLSYAQRLEARQPINRLEATPAGAMRTPQPGSTPLRAPTAAPTPARPAVTAKPTPTRVAATPAPTRTPAPARASATSVSTTALRTAVTLQVGAFKDKDAAEKLRAQLQRKGYHAYLMESDRAGAKLYNVRVGSYATRSDAEKIKTRLEAREKLKPFIVQP